LFEYGRPQIGVERGGADGADQLRDIAAHGCLVRRSSPIAIMDCR
jgi:hypothetical protein